MACKLFKRKTATHIFLSANALYIVGIQYIFPELPILQGLKILIIARTLSSACLDHPGT